MKKLLILFAAVALLAGFSGVSIAGIVGSAHDFSEFDLAGGQICLPCHTPHNGELVEGAPLWNHDLSDVIYELYDTPSLDAVVGQPTGASKLCLSCHDGTVAVDSFGGEVGNTMISTLNADADLGTTLADDHPISFVYNSALATTDPGLFDPDITNVTIGSGTFSKNGSITEVMLADGVLQCQGCHSVHNDFVAGDDFLLKISVQGSELCLACHNK